MNNYEEAFEIVNNDKIKIKERDELASEICKNICIQNNCANGCSCTDKPCNHAIYVAEELVKIGYHKQIWHKVADGDLPKVNELVLCLRSDRYNNRFTTGCLPPSSRTILWDLSDNDDTYESLNSIVAWTELPEYR